MFNDPVSKKIMYYLGWSIILVFIPILLYIILKVGLNDKVTGKIAPMKYWIESILILLFCLISGLAPILLYGNFKKK